MVAVWVLDQKVKAVGALQSYVSRVHISEQGSPNFKVDVRRRDESYAKWRELWMPEQGIGIAGETVIALNMQPQRSDSSLRAVSREIAPESIRWTTLA